MDEMDEKEAEARPLMGTIFLVLEKWFPLQGERAHSLNFFCLYVS